MGLFDGTPLERPVFCERCNLDIKICSCPPPDNPPENQLLQVRLEKRKRGKVVTVVSGFQCSVDQIQASCKALQAKCGAGGTVDGQTVEIQGDQMSRVTPLLVALGYRIQNKGLGK